MNTDIDFINIAEGDKEFVKTFENFVNGRVSSTEKTGMAMTAMHRYLQQQAFQGLSRLYESPRIQLPQRTL